MKSLLIAVFLMLSMACLQAQEWTDFPMKPEMTEIWNPEVPVIKPGKTPADAPSDAILLFDGKDLSQWTVPENTVWTVKQGVATIVPSAERLDKPTYIFTKKEFGDVQLHIEWKTPEKAERSSQKRGNSGILFAGLYEVQVLDNFNNRTYRNGQAGSVYKQYAPLVNACKAPGEWQVYDIVYTAPRFNEDGSFFTPPYVTVIHNGALVQNHVAIRGPVKYIGIPEYFIKPHGKAPIYLQDHGCAVSYRNIWAREL